jgi:hypothetical protein
LKELLSEKERIRARTVSARKKKHSERKKGEQEKRLIIHDEPFERTND